MAKEINIEINVSKKGAEKNLQTIGVGLKGIQEGAKAAGKSMLGLNTNFKGTVVVKAFTAILEILRETFMSNQKVVDTFATATTALKLVFNDLFKFIESNIGTVVGFFKDIFENPVESLKAFGKAILDNLIERFNSALEVIGHVGKAIGKLLKGDFKGALDSVKDAGKEYVDVLTGVDDSADKIAETTKKVVEATKDYTKSIVDQAKEITKLNNDYKLTQAINAGLIEQYDRQAEQQRQLRDDTRLTVEERIAANQELARILDDQEKKLLENAQIAVNAANAELALDEDNIDAKVRRQEALNELAAIRARIAGQRSEQLTNEAALEKELIDLETSKAQGIQEATSIEEKAKAELMDNEVQRLERLKSIEAEERSEIEKTLQTRIDSFKKGTQERVDAENELLKFQKEATAQENARDKEIADAKVAAISGALGAIANLVGQNSGFGKAIAITQAIIDTYAGATKALGQGGIFGFVGAATVIAAGLANVKTIASTKQPQPPSFAKGGGASAPIPAAASAAPPAFNVVGATAESQLAQTIATAQQKPVRAYVVSTDMSSQQALDRKTANQATLGN
tara:strand:- start:1598 stop:3313 length:1716 start_codon:yes stop_codon:yes gene_type:complete